jgi:hypothetical protein
MITVEETESRMRGEARRAHTTHVRHRSGEQRAACLTDSSPHANGLVLLASLTFQFAMMRWMKLRLECRRVSGPPECAQNII